MSKKVEVKVPASTANLGPGFDSIGMAFQCHLKVSVQSAEKLSMIDHSPGHEDVPLNEDNLIYQNIRHVFAEAGKTIPALQIEVASEIPLTRGLGSSASAIVAGLFAGNALLGDIFTKEELYRMATEKEDHPDNVGASIYGNIVVATWDGKEVQHLCIDPPQSLSIVAAIPDFMLSTSKARQAVPEQVSRRDAVYNIGHSSLLVASLLTGDLEKLKTALRDRLHQPYRTAFIPGMEQLMDNIEDYGAYGAVLSGAGPTLLALCHQDRSQSVQHDLQAFFAKQPYPCRILELPVDRHGVQVQVYDQTPAATPFLD